MFFLNSFCRFNLLTKLLKSTYLKHLIILGYNAVILNTLSIYVILLLNATINFIKLISNINANKICYILFYF